MILRILMALLFSFWLMSDPYQKFAKQIASGEMPNNFSELRWACMLSSHCDAAASLKWRKKFERATLARGDLFGNGTSQLDVNTGK